MTFFLPEKPVDLTASGLSGGLPTQWESFSARWQASSLEGGARNLEDVVATQDAELDRAVRIAERLGVSALQDGWAKTEWASDPLLGAAPASIDEFLAQHIAGRLDINAIGQEAAAADPEAWKDIDFSEEFIRNDVNERLRANYDDLQKTLAMSSESWARDMLAEFGSGTLNIKTAPALFAGGLTGGGSWLGIAAREAAINVGVEATLMPSQFEMAERLDIPDPNVAQQLGQAALFGAGFGVAFEALGRGLRYAFGRRSIRPAGMSAAEGEIFMQQLEEALVRPNGFERVREVIESRDPPAPTPAPGRAPLLKEAPPEEVSPAPGNAPEPPPEDPTISGMVEDAMNEADRLEADARRGVTNPLLAEMRRRGVKVDPASPEGQELYAMGITPRSMPGLFRKGGAAPNQRAVGTTSLDNMVADEWDELLPGLKDGAGSENGYLSRDGVLEILRRETAGDFKWLRGVQEADRLRKGARANPIDEYLGGNRTSEDPNAFFINRDEYLFAFSEPEAEMRIRQSVARWMDESGYSSRLTDTEKAEVAHAMAKHGGDPEFLVEGILQREMDWVDSPNEIAEDVPFGGPEDARGDGAPAAGPVPGEAGSGGAGFGPGRSGDFPVERTAIGDQFLVPGTERAQTGLSQRQRAEMEARAQQSKIRKADQTRVEDDAGGLFGGAQRSIFDDPLSPEAQAVHGDMAADLRTAIETDGDIKVDLGDGKGERTMSSVLDDLDQGDMFASRIELCGKGP